VGAAIRVKEYFLSAEDIAVFVFVPYRLPKAARKLLRVELDDNIDVVRAGMCATRHQSR
jgi:hypothetical protein